MNKWLLPAVILISIASQAQVNLQTGAAEIEFPLFKYSDAKSRLSTGITLKYISGNGMKVNDVATAVGTGWALQAGGVITRIQHGVPDDQYDYTYDSFEFDNIIFSPNVDNEYPNGYMYSPVSPENPVPGKASWLPYFPSGMVSIYKYNFEDREMDTYYFSFNNRGGRFVIGKNKVPVVIEDSKLKVTFVEQDMSADKVRTRISSFTITDENGIQYKFSEREVADVMKYQPMQVLNNYKILKGVELSSNAIRKIVSRWFLTEIVNPLTNEKIIFNYDNVSLDVEGVRHVSRQTIVEEDDVTHEIVVERTKMVTKRLSSISLPDEQTVSFVYTSADRVDLPGDKAIKEVNFSYGSKFLYSYEFNYSYFFKDQIVPYSTNFLPEESRYARLCLTDFRKKGADGTSLPPHIFTYIIPPYMGEQFTGAPRFTLYADHWGYYNPSTFYIGEYSDGTLACCLLEKNFQSYNETFLKFGIIKSITYPAGGSLEFEYEMNQAEESSYPNKYAGGIRVSSTKVFDGISHSNDIIKEYKYVNEDQTSSAWGYEEPSYTETLPLRVYKPSGTVYSGGNRTELFSNFVSSFFGSAGRSSLPAFGFWSNANSAVSLKGAFQAMVINIIANIIELIFTDPYEDYQLSTTKSDNSKLINPLPFQYSRVEVIEAANGSKTVYKFTNPSTSSGFALRDAGPYGPPFSGKQRYAHWLYGLPEEITWLKPDGISPVRKVTNVYNPIVREIQDANYLSKSWSVNSYISYVANPNGGPFSSTNITTESFYPIQGRVELQKTTETVYNSSGESTTIETEYTYSPNNFQVRTVSRKDSKGDCMGSTTYYVADYDKPGIISKMKSANMVNMPISVNHWSKGGDPENNEALIWASVTHYGENGDIRPMVLYESELAEPAMNTVADPDNFDPGNYYDYPYLKQKMWIKYSDGNPVQITSLSGHSTKSTLYDYNNRLPVAEIVNASPEKVCYTSFETDYKGNWEYNPAQVQEVFCVTGKRCFDLSAGNISKTNAPDSEPIIVSMWTKGSSILVNQATPSKEGPVINGWKYCEFTITPSGGSGVTITGNGLVDEVRLYPMKARMSTCTYEPGFGKTSECDATNRILYYEYDALGRLIKVRDQQRNLVKAYEYNFKQ